MCKELNVDTKYTINDSTLYKIDKSTFIISNPTSRKLLSYPEIIGVEIPHLLEAPIADFLQYCINPSQKEKINIVNILRGGLNFPIEDACQAINYPVESVSFLTSERVFLDKRVSRIESKYRKIIPLNMSTIIIGDIIASGETLINTIHYLMEQFILDSKCFKKILVFTIGTFNTLKAIHQLNQEILDRWPSFEGITAIFFEGIFTTYPNEGMTRLNLPHVDFFIKKGIIAPEFREDLLKSNSLIFEKCSIYDGGARRFEQHDHIKCILAYWENLHKLSDCIDIRLFLSEKFGHDSDISFDEWLKINNYKCSDNNSIHDLFIREINFYSHIINYGFGNITKERLNHLKNYYSFYLTE